MTPTCQLYQGDCLREMERIPDRSIDLVCCDLPYQATRCSWDRRIDPVRLWAHYRRILAPNGAIVLNADLRLACDLMATAPKGWYRYDLVWDKVLTRGFLDAKRRPLRRHELALVFSPIGYLTYNPQMTTGTPYRATNGKTCSVYRDHKGTLTVNTGTRYPTSIIRFATGGSGKRLHSTQKPTDLTDWIVATYSNPGDTVLDNAAGSFTTGVSALTLGRSFIGIELEPAHFEAGKARLDSYLVRSLAP